MSEPLVSVIMLTFNREKYVVAAIDSVLQQSHANLELIIVDDGSVDNTKSLLEEIKDPRVSCYFLPHSGYGSRMRNFGLSKSKGSLIAFLDSDDLWLPEKLEKQVLALAASPAVAFSFTDVMEVDSTGTALKQGIYKSDGWPVFEGNLFEKYVNNQFAIYPSTLLFRKSFIDETGNFLEYHRWTDNEFMYRLAYLHDAYLFYEPLAKIRKHDQNHSTLHVHDTPKEMIPLLDSLRRKNRISVSTFDRMTAYYYYMDGMLYWREQNYGAASGAFLKSIPVRPFNWKTWVRFLASKILFHWVTRGRHVFTRHFFPMTSTLPSGIYIEIANLMDRTIYDDLFSKGDYDEAITASLASSTAPVTIVDLGTNVGFFILRVADLMSTQKHAGAVTILGVEGSEQLCWEARRRIGISKLSDQLHIEITHGLIGAKTGTGVLYEFHDHGLNSIHRSAGRKKTIDFINLSDFLKGVESIDLLKCDIEGSEEVFLENYPDILQKTKSAIFEFHTEFVDLTKCREMMHRHGFKSKMIQEYPGSAVYYFWKA